MDAPDTSKRPMESAEPLKPRSKEEPDVRHKVLESADDYKTRYPYESKGKEEMDEMRENFKKHQFDTVDKNGKFISETDEAKKERLAKEAPFKERVKVAEEKLTQEFRSEKYAKQYVKNEQMLGRFGNDKSGEDAPNRWKDDPNGKKEFLNGHDADGRRKALKDAGFKQEEIDKYMKRYDEEMSKLKNVDFKKFDAPSGGSIFDAPPGKDKSDA